MRRRRARVPRRDGRRSLARRRPKQHRVRVAQQRFGKEAVADAHDPLLRFYNTPKSARVNLATESASGWQTAEAPQVAHMSAIGYYFGKQLRDALANGIAVGVVDCYIGGTSISAWMSDAFCWSKPWARA